MTELAGASVAISNRGEIAIRIARTCRRLGTVPILLAGEPDRESLAAREIGQVEIVGEAGSELDIDRVIAAAVRVRADFLHPGYGFLSERAELSEACAAAGIRFVGPSPETLRLCGDKIATRDAAERAGVPTLPASPSLGDDQDSWREAAGAVGYPLLVKPAEAGGGRGLRRVATESELANAVLASRREIASTGSTLVYFEREMTNPRHVEVQVAGSTGEVAVLGDRDCSVQRRHQKVIEEAPAPNVDPATRQRLHLYARAIAEAVGLSGIATCEFLLGSDGLLAFLEVNPRIQVEHPVTELVTGIDLVEWQLRIAKGEVLPARATPEPNGHAIEARVYAEDPWHGFFPSPGTLMFVSWPSGPGVRVDAGYATGDHVPSDYDSMIAKVIAHAPERETALMSLRSALLDTIVSGVETNLAWLIDLLDDDSIQAGRATTATSVPPTMPDRYPALVTAGAHLLERAGAGAGDAWSAIGPWRHSGAPQLFLHGADWEEQVTVIRSGSTWVSPATEGRGEVRAQRTRDGAWTLQHDGNRARLAVVESSGALEVAGGGGRWLIGVGPRPWESTGSGRAASDGRVTSPLPATVLSIHVQPGDEVAAKQPLVTLYAMKMELVCPAPAAGKVVEVHCAVGTLVDADELLVEIEVAGDA
jgi:acetyl-CoA/propionyl-CoA carboxylase biotin carboxyl carrier protein